MIAKEKSFRIVLMFLSGLTFLYATAPFAQNYPSKPIRLILPLAPGGATDVVVRIVFQKVSEQLGVSVVVENRAGAGTVIGTELLSKAVPDGYTLAAVGSEFSINPSMRKLPYDTVRDFTCSSQMTSSQYFVTTHPSVPVRTVRQFIDLAKSRPAQITFGSGGAGSANHLAGMLFQQLTGTRLIHVPYKGGGPANAALLSGEIDFTFSNTASAIPHIKSGKFRAIASTGPHRTPIAPEVPTVAESGVPLFVVTGFYVLIAPAGTPRGIISRLNSETIKALQAPTVRTRLNELGTEPVGSTPEACAALVASEIARWAPIVKASGATAD